MTEPTVIFDSEQAGLLVDIRTVRSAIQAAGGHDLAGQAFDRILSVAAVQQSNYRAALDRISYLEDERDYLTREAHRGVRVRHSERLFAEWVLQATDVELLREGRAQAAAEGTQLAGDDDAYVRGARQNAREVLARLDFRRTTMAEVISEHVVSSLIDDPDGADSIAQDIAETLTRDPDGTRAGAWGWTGKPPVVPAEDLAGVDPGPRLFDPAVTGPLTPVTDTAEEAPADGPRD